VPLFIAKGKQDATAQPEPLNNQQPPNPNRFNALCGAVVMDSGREVPLVSESKTIHARIPNRFMY
jgi:hypothetical protein